MRPPVAATPARIVAPRCPRCEALCAVRGVLVKVRSPGGCGDGTAGGLAGAEETSAAVDAPIGFLESWGDDCGFEGAQLRRDINARSGVARDRAAAEVASVEGFPRAPPRHGGAV